VTPVDKRFDVNMMATAIWRPLKRLKDIIESFLMASVPNSCLYIAGDISASGLSKDDLKKYGKMNNIVFLGNINRELLSRYLVICDAFLHLSLIDSCPNSVVEALCAGIGVVSNNISGTAEIVKPSGGYICDIDSEFDFRPRNLGVMPQIDRSIVCEKILQCVREKKKPIIDHVHIENVSNQYLSFFNSYLL
jgi:glycosyltransferase involved in cell wall biosynthesis